MDPYTEALTNRLKVRLAEPPSEVEHVQLLEEVLNAFQQIQPVFSDEEIDQIAERVAKRIVAARSKDIPPDRSNRLRRGIRDISYGAIGSLIATGVIDALPYLEHLGHAVAGRYRESAMDIGENARRNQERELRINEDFLSSLKFPYRFSDEFQLNWHLSFVISQTIQDAVRSSDLNSGNEMLIPADLLAGMVREIIADEVLTLVMNRGAASE